MAVFLFLYPNIKHAREAQAEMETTGLSLAQICSTKLPGRFSKQIKERS